MKYAAFIRGIGPEDPNTRNAKLKALFESLGFSDVQPFISSGNVIFSSGSRSAAALEKKIERALAAELSTERAVFVRSQPELERLMKKDPFKGKTHSRETYLLVTFMKGAPRESFSVVDARQNNGAGFMSALDRTHGKAITSRTWKTVSRILAKMQAEAL